MPNLANVRVKWDGGRIDAEIAKDAVLALDALALAIQNQAEQNIAENDQIDTGFMHDSGYVITGIRDTFVNVSAGGQYVSSKTGALVWRFSRAKPPGLRGKKNAIVGFAAKYALYPELQNSFFYRAIETVDADEIVKKSLRGEI